MSSVPPNPFATRFVSPDRVPFVEEVPGQIEQRVEDWASAGFLGQIVGPHGSGKTTLAIHLARQLLLRETDRNSGIHLVTIRKPQHWLTTFGLSNNLSSWVERSTIVATARADHAVLLLDGFERLRRLTQFTVLHHLRRRAIRCLITTHRALNDVPVIAQRDPSLEELTRVAKSLCGDANAAFSGLSPGHLEAVFGRHGGNLRECLMELYDDWQRKSDEAKSLMGTTSRISSTDVNA